MSLETLLPKIKELREIANQDLYATTAMVREFKRGQIESAKHELEQIYIQYKNEILRRSIFILVNGSLAQKFAEVSEKEFGCFSHKGSELFEEIVDQMSPQFYVNAAVDNSTFEIAGNLLESKLKELDVISYPAFLFESKYQSTLKGRDDLVSLLKEAITNKVGGEIVGLDALEKATRKAFDSDYKSKVVPILIFDQDTAFINSLLNTLPLIGRTVKLSVGEVSEEGSANSLVVLEKATKTEVKEALTKVSEIANK